jgi:hypothetical protein
MTQAVLGAGSSLQLLDTTVSPNAYVTIAEVLTCGPIGYSTTEVDVTNLDSTAKEYITGLQDGNQVEFEVNWLAGNTQQEQLRDAGTTAQQLKMIWSGTSPQTTATFTLAAISFSRGETTPESQQTGTIGGRISGSITWA